MPQLLTAAKFPKVTLKATGAPSDSVTPCPLRDVYGYLKQRFGTYGPQRLVWGTDIMRMPCGWRQR